MLLAFQRDDSTSFTKSSRHRQRRREMGENCCTCLFSLCASVLIVHGFLCTCQSVHPLFWVLYHLNPFNAIFGYLKKDCKFDLHFF